MRLTFGAVATALLGLASAAPFDLAKKALSDDCSISSGEVILTSLVIVEKPVVIQSYIVENMFITIEESVTIWIGNAPTQLTTTVSVTTTSTKTTTLSTATVTYTPPAVIASVDPTTTGTVSPEDTSKAIVLVSSSQLSGVGRGVDTSLYTATSTYSHSSHRVTTTAVSLHTYWGGNSTTVSTATITTATTSPTSLASGEFTDWTVFKGNGVNLGGWLELELANNPQPFTQYAPNATDEWSFCQTLGSRCGPILEERYATFITTATIDKLATVGVNILRVPTTYAVWAKVPGSQLYHGNQQKYLQAITKYAIETYGMRIVIDLHSLPGGINNQGHGEAVGHDGWWYNATNLAWSYKVVEAALDFIQASGNAWAYTLAPINEPSDNPAGFGTGNDVTANGTAYLVAYFNGVLERTAAVDKRIPIMLQDAFQGMEHWTPYFDISTNLVIDTHVYYVLSAGVYPEYADPAICGQATVVAGDGKFPVFIGEWSAAVEYNNSLSHREKIFNTQRYAWNKYAAGGAFWTIDHTGNDPIDGEGTVNEYWSYLLMMDQGVIKPVVANATYC